MMDEIFSGESQTIVLRCRDANGEPVAMYGRVAEVVMADRFGHVIFDFSTEKEGNRRMEVEDHYLLCPVSAADMAKLKGVYLIEIRVTEGDSVQITQVPGIRVLDCITRGRS